MPDFVGIGAQKSGTTWLHRNLQAHPEIWMPKEKELHYFDEKMSLGGGLLAKARGERPVDKRWRRQFRSRLRQPFGRWDWADVRWDLKYFFGRPDDAWYLSLFEPGRGKVTGESTPDYAILEKDAIARMHDLMPEAKILFMIRNPIERPWSALDMRSRIRGESLEEMGEQKLRRRFEARGSRIRTDYLKTLENWGAFYPQEQVFLGFLEDVSFFPRELLRGLYSFLGVDPAFEPPLAEKKVHSGQQSTIPTRVATHLAEIYHDEIGRLAQRLGGYASFWLYCAERLTESPPPEDHIPYPLYTSSLWDEWVGGAGPGPGERPCYGSGPLAPTQAAKRDV